MPRFSLQVADSDTGSEASIELEADDPEGAIAQANQRGFVVEALAEIPVLDYSTPRNILKREPTATTAQPDYSRNPSRRERRADRWQHMTVFEALLCGFSLVVAVFLHFFGWVTLVVSPTKPVTDQVDPKTSLLMIGVAVLLQVLAYIIDISASLRHR